MARKASLFLESIGSGTESKSEEEDNLIRYSKSHRLGNLVAGSFFGVCVGIFLSSVSYQYKESVLADIPSLAKDSTAKASHDVLSSKTWGSGTCARYGCGPYQAHRNCQCNVDCQ